MADIRRPDFLKNVEPSAPGPLPASAARVRSVAWAAAPLEPSGVLPGQPLTAPMPMPTVSIPRAPMPSPIANDSNGFDALPPMPLPSAPMMAQAAAHQSPPRQELPAKLEAAIVALRQQGRRLAEQARSDSLEIGLLVARRILERELATSLEPLFSLIRSAVRKVGEANRTTVKLSPADAARMQDVDGSDFSFGRVEIVADQSLGIGDVVVETEHHTVDGRLETRLEEVRRELLGSMEA